MADISKVDMAISHQAGVVVIAFSRLIGTQYLSPAAARAMATVLQEQAAAAEKSLGNPRDN